MTRIVLDALEASITLMVKAAVTKYAGTIGAFNTPAHVSRLVSYIKSDNKL